MPNKSKRFEKIKEKNEIKLVKAIKHNIKCYHIEVENIIDDLKINDIECSGKIFVCEECGFTYYNNIECENEDCKNYEKKNNKKCYIVDLEKLKQKLKKKLNEVLR